MTTSLYPQHPRPWEGRLVASNPAEAGVVWIFTISPETEAGEDRRSVTACARYAEWVARRPGVLGASWSRTAVDVVVEAVGGQHAAESACLDRTARLGPVSWFSTSDPTEWDWAQASAERLARAALGDRHQCWGHVECLCGHQGNRWATDTIVERGFLLGAGARR